MRRVVPCIATCLLLVATADASFAQQRLFVRTPAEVVELDTRLPSLGAVLRRFPAPEDRDQVTDDLTTFGGGRYIVWVDGLIEVFDTTSGAVSQFAFPGFVPTRVIGTDGNAKVIILGSRVANELSILVANAASGTLQYRDLGPASLVGPITYAPAADALFIARRSAPPTSPAHMHLDDVDVMRGETGELLKTIDISSAFAMEISVPWATSLLVNSDGTRLFVAGAPGGTFGFDVLAGTPGPSSNVVLPRLIVDEPRNRLLAASAGGIVAYAADSLALLGQVTWPGLPSPPPSQSSGSTGSASFDVSGVSATMFSLESRGWYTATSPVCTSQLVALDAASGQVRRSVATTGGLGLSACSSVNLVRLTEPAAPAGLAAEVVGRQVTLTWQAPFGATGYELEAAAASTPGSIATFRVSNARLVVDGVPPGTYLVRVRGSNIIGKSSPSSIVQVFVQ